MKSSLGLGNYAGIPLKLHWTFGLILIYISYISYQEGLTLFFIIYSLVLILSLFGCVVLHEYGHALTARKYGVKTKDIILTPIGGLARLSHIPEIPMQELVIAVAGPLVNLVIVALCILLFRPLYGWPGIEGFGRIINGEPSNLIQYSLVLFGVMNAIILLFNLLPAFPMDGGRVFRALLAMKINRVLATRIASNLGQLMSIGFLVWGIYNNQFTLALIGIFIFMSARAEYQSVKYADKFNSTPIKKLLTYNGKPNFYMKQSLADVSDFPDDNYAILNQENQPVGILFKNQMTKARKMGFLDQNLIQMMYPIIEKLQSSLSIKDAIDIFKRGNHNILPVMIGDEFIGLLSRENIQDYLKNLKV